MTFYSNYKRFLFDHNSEISASGKSNKTDRSVTLQNFQVTNNLPILSQFNKISGVYGQMDSTVRLLINVINQESYITDDAMCICI